MFNSEKDSLKFIKMWQTLKTKGIVPTPKVPILYPRMATSAKSAHPSGPKLACPLFVIHILHAACLKTN